MLLDEIFGATAIRRPSGLDLGDDPFPEHVAGTGERERSVGVEALETTRAVRTGDPELERRSVVLPAPLSGKLTPDPALLLGSPLE